MIKRYYQGLLSMKYSPLLVGGALLVFICAFLDVKHPDSFYKYLLMLSAIILLFIMYLYYGKKIKIHKDIKAIDKIDRYLDAKMIGSSFFLEDTMLVNNSDGIKEYRTDNVLSVEKIENKKPTIKVETGNNTLEISANSLEDLEKLAAFFKRKNPNIKLLGIEAKGTGILKEFKR